MVENIKGLIFTRVTFSLQWLVNTVPIHCTGVQYSLGNLVWGYNTSGIPDSPWHWWSINAVSGEGCGLASRWVQLRSSSEHPSYADSAGKKSPQMTKCFIILQNQCSDEWYMWTTYNSLLSPGKLDLELVIAIYVICVWAGGDDSLQANSIYVPRLKVGMSICQG